MTAFGGDESITFSKYNFRSRMHVRRIREEIKNLLAVCLLLTSIAMAFALQNYIPIQSVHAKPEQKPEKVFTDYQELLLQFYDENESARCLQWINKTPAKRFRFALKKAKIHSNRIDTLLSNRPYSTWTEVLYLPKIGMKTIDNIITAWRISK